jgi:hypothetical protein
MAPQTLPPASVNRQFRPLVLIEMDDPLRGPRRTVAVFALDNHMRRLGNTLVLVGMAVLAVFRTLVFDLNVIFPFLYIALTIPAIHVTAFMYAEILWDIEKPGNKYKDNKAYDNDQRPEDMVLHELHLVFAIFY